MGNEYRSKINWFGKMVGKMSKVQVFAKDAKRGMQEFFRLKTSKEDFSYFPINSRLQPIREVAVSTVAVGSRKFTRYVYEQVRSARARV